MTVTFLQISRKPQLRSRTYFFGRPMISRFQQYIVRTEILSTFHARAKYISVKNTSFKPMGRTHLQIPLPIEARGPHLIHPSLDRPTPLTTPNGIQIQSAVLLQYTFRADRQTHRHTDRPTSWTSDSSVALTLCYSDSERRAGFSWWEAWGSARGITLV